MLYIRFAFKAGMSLEKVQRITTIDPWFLSQLQEIVMMENTLLEGGEKGLNRDNLREAKEYGFSDTQIAHLTGIKIAKLRELREKYNINTVYRLVDTWRGGV